MSPARSGHAAVWERWIPVIVGLLVQALTLAWFAAKMSAQTAQNAQDIKDIRQAMATSDSVKDSLGAIQRQLDSQDHKFDILLQRDIDEKNQH